MDKVVIITGPTAVGKTKCSLLVAQALKTQIINGDAYQVYKDMNIGTAKPTNEELALVKHHLIDYLDPLENFSVADYQRLVREKIYEFKNNNLVTLIVGGSAESMNCAEIVYCPPEVEGESEDPNFNRYL